MKLNYSDLKFITQRIPSNLLKLMKKKKWENQIYIGGGFIRSVITNDKINDIDIFVQSKDKAEILAHKLANSKKDIYETDNAFTIRGYTTIQVIHRWVFEKAEDVSNSFDFTNCCSVVWYENKSFDSFCDDNYYKDLAAKRLVYRNPVRNEDAGGSMLRVLKYYQKGYRIPIDSLGGVIARLVGGINTEAIDMNNQEEVTRIITGLLREVDPDIDPTHASHLPSQTTYNKEETKKDTDER